MNTSMIKGITLRIPGIPRTWIGRDTVVLQDNVVMCLISREVPFLLSFNVSVCQPCCDGRSKSCLSKEVNA